MATVATLTLSGNITGAPSGARTLGPFTLTSAAANGTIQQMVLANGANTITVPTLPLTSGCIVQLAVGNTAVVTLKGIAGDTGIAMGKTGWFCLNWDPTAPPANFVLSSAGAQTGLVTELLFF